MSKKYAKPIIIGFLMILTVPLIVSFLMESPLMDIGNQKAESWMGFWGGYLGAILGIGGAITATTIQIKSQTEQMIWSAIKADELERQRIYSSLILDKNDALYQRILELKNNVTILTDSLQNELLNIAKLFHSGEINRIINPTLNLDDSIFHTIESLCIGIQSYQLFIKNDEEYGDEINLLISDIDGMMAFLGNPFEEDKVYDNEGFQNQRVELMNSCLHILENFDIVEVLYLRHMLILTESVLIKKDA